MGPLTPIGTSSPSSAPGGRVDREALLQAAERIVDAEGIGALTMRRLGAELRVDPSATYRIVRGKDELLDLLAGRFFARLPAVDPQANWREELIRLLTVAMNLYRQHPNVAATMARHPDENPVLQGLAETVLGLLAQGGLDPAQQAHGYRLLTNHVAGTGVFYALIEQASGGQDYRAYTEGTRRNYAALDPATHPHCVAAAPHLFGELDAAFDHGLRILIDALEALGRSAPTPPPSEEHP